LTPSSPPKTATRWARLEARLLPPSAWQGDRLHLWRERVLTTIVLLAVGLGPLALIPSVALAAAEGRWGVAALDLAAYGVAVAVLAGRRWPLAWRAWAVCLLVYVLGLGLMLMLGFFGAGYLWLFAASVLAGGLLGMRAALWSLGLNLAAMAVVGVCLTAGLMPWAQGVANVMEKWGVMTVNFLLLNALVAITVALMLTGLRDALAGEQEVSADLRQSEARFRALGQNAPDVVFTLEADGRFSYVNPALERVMGVAPAEVLGRHYTQVMAPGRAPAFDQALALVLETGQTVQEVEGTLPHADGRRLHLSLSAAPNTDQEGRPAGVVGLLKDVTEQKRLLSQLQHSQKMEAVGTLAGGIAHDFNNILAAITGYAELALDEATAQGRPASELQEVLAAADRAKDLVQRILAFSHKMEPELRLVDLNQKVRQAARILSRTIPKMIEIELELAEDLALVRADAGQLEQVLLNLGANARDAMPEGGTLTISTANAELDAEFCRLHPGAVPGWYVRLTVSDTGQGLDAQTREHIFEPFYTTKGPGRGTGLGLAIIFGTVKSHGGYILCQSQPGSGASFDIYLPAAAAGQDPAADGAPRPAAPPAGGATLLVVDDEPALRDIAARILERAGYQALKADSGEQALELLRQAPQAVDLVVLDLGLPGMGGPAALERLLEERGDLKVLIATGYARENELAAALAAGAAGRVAKPFRQAELLTKVAEALAGENPPA
jgi:PAS domain S-box-containing protein